jgi:hypothetical protein
MISGQANIYALVGIALLAITGGVLNLWAFKLERSVWRWIKLSYATSVLLIAAVYGHLILSGTHLIPVEVVRWVNILLLTTIVASGALGVSRVKYGSQ